MIVIWLVFCCAIAKNMCIDQPTNQNTEEKYNYQPDYNDKNGFQESLEPWFNERCSMHVARISHKTDWF